METITLLDNKESSDGHSSSKITLRANGQISSALKEALSAYSSSEHLPEHLTEDGLWGEFLTGGESTILRLDREGFEWIKCSRGISRRVELCDVTSVTHEEPKSSRFCFGLCNNDDDEFHKLVIHSFERNRKKSAIWTPIRFTFASSDRMQIIQWSEKANELISEFKQRPKRLWVFVNPFGGARQAPVIWKNQVKPLFDLAGIQSHVVITKEANEAQELMKTTPKEALDSLDGVIAVGGDGLFQEIMNGMLERSTNPGTEQQEIINERLRLGHIPAGSTDAVAWSVNGSRCPISAALRIVFGDRLSLDVMKIESEDHSSSRYSACLAGYGFMGDVISMSEHLRYFGPMRYDLAGVMAFFSLNSHRAKVSYIKSTENSAFVQLQSSTGSDLEIIEDEFISIMITVNPCRSDKSPNGLIPHAELSDGRLHVVLVKTCPRWQYLSFLVSAAKHGIRPGQFPFVQTIDVEWVKVEPLESQSSWNVDGEVIRQQRLTSMVHNGLIQVFARGVEQ